MDKKIVNDITHSLSEKRIQLITWTLLCLMPLIGMAVDLIAPSLPAITNSLQIAPSVTKNVISIYLLGYALGNFFTGFLTDAFGRQKLLRLALLAFIVVSLLPVFFPRVGVLLSVRFLQGITLGSTAVLARAVFADILLPEKLIRLGTLMGTMWGLGPVIGPVIGGYLQFYFGWKAGFCFFALIAFLGFVAVIYIVPETHLNRHPLNIKRIKTTLIEVLSHRLFMALVILMGLMYSLIIIFNTLAPFLIQVEMHYSPIFFGHLALWLGLVFLASTFVCRYLLKKYKVEQLYFIIVNLFLIVTLIGVLASYLFANSIILVGFVSALMYFACGFIFPLSMGKGMSLFRHIAGTAAALMYLINILITSLTAFLASFISIHSAISLMWIYFCLMLLSSFVYWGMIRRSS